MIGLKVHFQIKPQLVALVLSSSNTGIVRSITSIVAVHYWYWHSIVPVPVLAFLTFGSVPVWAQFITGTGIQLCPYRYWHCCTLVQYQYGHSPLPILAFNCAHTGIGISAVYFSTSMGIVHYQYWHSKMVPVLVLSFLHFGSVPVWAQSITGTGIQKWCLNRYWHSCTFVQYQYGHSPLLLLAFNSARTGIGIFALGSVPVWAQSITGTGIQKWCPCRYWHFCTLFQYQYGHNPLLVLAFKNGAHTSIGMFALLFSTS